jgi:hypothetical protein
MVATPIASAVSVTDSPAAASRYGNICVETV